MSRENVELRAMADAACAALNSGDLDRFMALVTEDVEFTVLTAESEGTVFRGHEGVRAWWETVVGVFDDVRWDLVDLRAVDARGVAHWRITGTVGGVAVPQTMWQAARLREGKLAWWATFRTEREALEAVGLRS